jgi:rhodanese-related sulfurtransferase
MNTRQKFSIGLISLGLILALLPLTGKQSFTVRPSVLLSEVLNEESYFTVDQVARFVVTEDSTVQIIDVRSPEEFREMNIPGSINIPYDDFLRNDPVNLLNTGKSKNIFYSNGDLESNFALAYAEGLNFKDAYVMKGGLNEWFNTIMNSRFTGESISPRMNAVFETRTKAGRLFTEMNSLPDSLKLKFFEAKKIAAKKLDGGCE